MIKKESLLEEMRHYSCDIEEAAADYLITKVGVGPGPNLIELSRMLIQSHARRVFEQSVADSLVGVITLDDCIACLGRLDNLK